MCQPKLFFILGCQRSGTTLMRFILESHSQISCVDEYRGYSLLQNPNLLKNEIKKNNDKKWFGFKLPRIAEQMLNPFLLDAGIDFHVTNTYKNQPIIFMTRNVFDVIASMKTLKEQNMPWIKIWPKKWLNFWIEKDPNLLKEYKDDISFWRNSRHNDIVAAAIMWKIKTQAIIRYQNEKLSVMPVNYEKLVKEPKIVIQEILNFLDLTWEDSLLIHHMLPHVEVDEHGIAIGNNDSKKPIFVDSINKYSKILNESEISEIKKVVD